MLTYMPQWMLLFYQILYCTDINISKWQKMYKYSKRIAITCQTELFTIALADKMATTNFVNYQETGRCA